MEKIWNKFSIWFVFLLVACRPATLTPPITPTSTVPVSTDTPISPTFTATAVITPTIPASTVELEGTELPEGFSLIKFADLPHPTAFAFDARGRMYVTSQNGKVYILEDTNKDGRADLQVIFSEPYELPLGVAIHAPTGDVYVSSKGIVNVLRDTNGDDTADVRDTFVTGLPHRSHQNDSLEFGPDGFLYMGIGSICNACDDPDPRSATIMRFNVETGEGEIYATGLRNPYDVAFHPETGDLFATDNGRDDLGLDTPFEELNHIVQGGDYGYPDCWNEQDFPGCEDTISAVAFFEAHSSANGVDFYNGQRFPAKYRNNAFVSIFGSTLKVSQTGIQRVILTPGGDTYVGEAAWFIKFPQDVTPLPILFGPDDALYMGDYLGNTIYRISYGLP